MLGNGAGMLETCRLLRKMERTERHSRGQGGEARHCVLCMSNAHRGPISSMLGDGAGMLETCELLKDMERTERYSHRNEARTKQRRAKKQRGHAMNKSNVRAEMARRALRDSLSVSPATNKPNRQITQVNSIVYFLLYARGC